jgi:hypothetical protein
MRHICRTVAESCQEGSWEMVYIAILRLSVKSININNLEMLQLFSCNAQCLMPILHQLFLQHRWYCHQIKARYTTNSGTQRCQVKLSTAKLYRCICSWCVKVLLHNTIND